MKTVATKSSLFNHITKITTLISIIYFSFLFNIKAQPPCNGIPHPGTIVAFQNPVCPGATFGIVYNSTESGVSFLWFSSTNGINFNPIPGAIQQQLFTSILQQTYFKCRIRCTQSGQTAFTQPLLITLIQPVINFPSTTVQLNSGESTHPDNTGYVTV